MSGRCTKIGHDRCAKTVHDTDRCTNIGCVTERYAKIGHDRCVNIWVSASGVQRLGMTGVQKLGVSDRISSDVNGLSVVIDNVNMRQTHFESTLNAGGRVAGPKVECGELNTKPMAMASNKMSDVGSQTNIIGDSEGRRSGNKLEHTYIAASDVFYSPMVQNVGLIDFVVSPRRVEIPSQPEAKTVVCCLCSNSVRSSGTPAQGAVSPSRTVVGDMRRQEGSTSSRADMYRWAKIRVPEFRGVTSGHPTWFNLKL